MLFINKRIFLAIIILYTKADKKSHMPRNVEINTYEEHEPSLTAYIK